MKAQKVNNPGDMEFHPPKWIMTTERGAKILRDTNLEERFPGIEIKVIPDSQLYPKVLERHDEE